MLEHETLIRLSFFAGLFVAFAAWEAYSPRRRRSLSVAIRWVSNLGMGAMNALIPPLIVPVAAVGVAIAAREHGVGLFNQYAAPYWLAFVASVVILDFAIYLQHVMFHAVPVLWRLHRVHHSDVDLDVSSGVRFHLIEILISLGIKSAVVLAIGPPAAAVFVFEILLNGTSMFNHANLRLPAGVDRLLRLIVVTPDMHRVHHSVVPREMNTNFGFNLPWWDRLCGTYTPQPAAGHEGMQIGLDRYRDAHAQRLDQLLVQPIQSLKATQPMLQPPAGPPAQE